MRVHEVATNVFLVEGSASNWAVLRDGNDLTLIDAGYPNDLAAVVASIEQLGHRLRDVRAVLVTHAHVDHIGALPGLQRLHTAPVLAHHRELPMLQGRTHEQASTLDVVSRCWRPRVASWALRAARAGARRTIRLPQARAVDTDVALDLPGSPVAVACHGHTSGHTAYHVPGAGVVLTGDALVTGHDLLTRDGPQLLPAFFSHDPTSTLETLDAIAALDADTVLPGHGPVWRGPVARAVEQARTHRPPGFGHAGA